MTNFRSQPVVWKDQLHVVRYYPPGVVLTDETQSYSETKVDSRLVGANLPDWRQRIRNGDPATTYLRGLRYGRRKIIPGVAAYSRGISFGYPAEWYQSGDLAFIPTNFLSPGTASIESAENEAKTRITRKIQEAATQFQSGIFLGELRETLRMIRSPAKSFRTGVTDYLRTVKKRRKGFKKSNHKWREVLSDTWLEYTFGWSPFLSDIDDAAHALARLGESTGTTKRVTGFSEVTETYDDPDTSVYFGYLRYKYSFRRKATYKVVYRAGVRSRPMSPALMRKDLLGFRLAEFAPTVYELVPWSFLIDYFSNIGDIVNGWSQQFGNISWKNRTTIQESSIAIARMYPDSTFNSAYIPTLCDDVVFVPSSGEKYFRIVERTGYDGNFIPEFTFEIPGVGSMKWANVAALIAGRKANRRRGFSFP